MDQPAKSPGSPSESLITITIQPVMPGPNHQVRIAKSAKVGELRSLVAEVVDISAGKFALLHDGKEMKDDDAPISKYGIVKDAKVSMNIKLATGISRRATTADVVFFVPMDLPKNDIGQLRTTIRSMHNRRVARVKPGLNESASEGSNIATREKQLEHEKIRDRMRLLFSRRKALKSRSKLFDSAEPQDAAIIDSKLCSTSVTPPEFANLTTSSTCITDRNPLTGTNSGSSTSIGSSGSLERPVTEKELRQYFPCAETAIEASILRRDLYLPPQNKSELDQIRAKFDLLARTRCKVCKKRLQLREQEQKCACDRAFCDRHRPPEDHSCPFDFKHQARTKLSKENPKIEAGGIHKGKIE